MPSRRPSRLPLLSAALIMCSAGVCHAQLRIVSYNTARACRDGMSDVLRGIADERRTGVTRPIDVISLQEQDASLTVTQAVADTLNAIYGPGLYARSTLVGAGDTTQSIVYNTATVQMVAQARVGSTSSNGAARQPMRFRLRPLGYTASADFYLYAHHYKAGDSDAARRNVEAQMVRADADALGPGVRILYTGDFNIYGSNESMWSTLTAPGNGQGADPLNRPGTPFWSGAAFADLHTQSPVVSADQYFSGQVGGGLDDRFDWQLVTPPVLSGRGFSYITGTYRSFGNTGHTYNSNLSAAGGQWLLPYFPTYTLAQVNNVISRLERVSDHIPVVADYRIPARMSATFAAGTQIVTVGYPATIRVEVANTAPVLQPLGADTLDFTATATGTLNIQPWSGVAPAASPAAAANLPLDTTTSGLRTGTIVVATAAPGVPVASFTSAQIQAIVLEHAAPSFAADAQLTTTSIDLGSVPRDSSPQQRTLRLYNARPGATVFTAGLDLLSVTPSPASPAITTTLTPFTNLTAGASVPFTVTLSTDQIGVHHARYLLATTDHGVLGAVQSTLVIDVTATVEHTPGDFTGDGRVDGADLDYVLANWGTTTDGADLDAVLANWGDGE